MSFAKGQVGAKVSNLNNEVFYNKNCLLTGASGGVGKEIAIQLARQGCNIFITGRKIKKLERLKKEIESQGNYVNVFYYTCDFNKMDDVKNLIKIVRKKFKKIDILINAAGIYRVKYLADSTITDFDESFNVNVRAPFIFIKEFSKDMIKNKWGRIVNIGSSSSYTGFKETSLYCASKHAILGLSRAIYTELKEYNIRTFCVSPSAVKTEMGKLIRNENYDTFIEPEELAKYVVFIISFDDNMVSEEVKLNKL